MFGKRQRPRGTNSPTDGEGHAPDAWFPVRSISAHDIPRLESAALLLLRSTFDAPTFWAQDPETQAKATVASFSAALSDALDQSISLPAASRSATDSLVRLRRTLYEGFQSIKSDGQTAEFAMRLLGVAKAELARDYPTTDQRVDQMWARFMLTVLAAPGYDTAPLAWHVRGLREALDLWVSPSDDGRDDVGPWFLGETFKLMQIDQEWSISQERSFTWWGHRLAQTVFADRPIVSNGVTVVQMRGHCDAVTGVADSLETYALLSELNAEAGLDALVFDPSSGRVSSELTCWVHSDTRWLREMFAMAVAQQCAVLEYRADHLAAVLGGDIATTAHPTSGLRPIPDGMVDVTQVANRFDRSVPISSAGYRRVCNFEQASWLTATAAPDGFHLTFPFDAEPVLATPDEVGTAVLTAGTKVQPGHEVGAMARLGDGVAMRLTVPRWWDEDESPSVANQLNRLEARGDSRAHLLGAWYADEGSVAFSGFLPSITLGADEDEAVVRVTNLVLTMAKRVRWASEMMAVEPLGGSEANRASIPGHPGGSFDALPGPRIYYLSFLDPRTQSFDAATLRDLSVHHELFGNGARLCGDAENTVFHYEALLHGAELLVQLEPQDLEAAHDLLVAHDRLAGYAAESGDAASSRAHYQTCFELASAIARALPNNERAISDLSIAQKNASLLGG